MQIVVTENIRIDGRDYVAEQTIATVDSDIALQTLTQMVLQGQARIVRTPLVVPPSGGKSEPYNEEDSEYRGDEDEESDDEPELTDASALASFGVTDRQVDLLLEHDPPLITKADVIEYLKTHKDLTPIHNIGKTSSDQILKAIGLK